MTTINETLYTEYEAQEYTGLRWEYVGRFLSFTKARQWFDACADIDAWQDRAFRVIARNGAASKVALLKTGQTRKN